MLYKCGFCCYTLRVKLKSPRVAPVAVAGKRDMKKRLICILVGALMLCMIPCAAFAEFDYTTVTTPKMFVCDGDDPTQVFYERAADEQAYPASTTKIMTCILALENLDLDQKVTVGEEVLGHYELSAGYSSKSSLMGLEVGETLTVRDILYGLMLVSGNDAADALAVAVAGSVKDFVAMMNEKAASLGMTNTHFVNPNGVQNENHYTTARDIATLTAYALKNEDFCTIVSTASYTLSATNMHPEARTKNNTNKLIYTSESDTESCLYEYAIGVKTGDTPAAGKCLVAAAKKDGATVICVLYNDASDAPYSRFHNAASIFEDVFANHYTLISGQELNAQTEFHCTIENGQAEDLDENGQLTVTADVSGLAMRVLPSKASQYQNGSAKVTAQVTWTSTLVAPIAEGTTLGHVDYVLDGKTLYTATLTAPSAVRETAIVGHESTGSASGDAASGSGNALLTVSTPVPGAKQSTDSGTSFGTVLLIVLGVVVGIVVIFIVVLLILREKRRREKRRRRQQRLAAQRRAQQRAQQGTGGTSRTGSGTASSAGTRTVSRQGTASSGQRGTGTKSSTAKSTGTSRRGSGYDQY